jgi:signal transduction histidine kinase
MMVHELKHPTNSIIGWVRILTTDSMSAEVKAKAIDRILACSEGINRSLDDILDYLARYKAMNESPGD